MQTQYQNMPQLIESVEEAARNKRDFIADTREIRMLAGGTLLAIPTEVDGTPQSENFAIDHHTHRQIGQRLKIRSDYMDRMRADAPDLYDETINTWFDREPERRMVRTAKGSTRAFLSDRYRRIEHEDIMDVILPVLQEFPDLQFRSLALTERKLYIKATLPSLRSEVKVGDIVEAGIGIDNSEIGQGAYRVVPFAMKLDCLNGMKHNVAGISAYHVGKRADEGDAVYEMLSDETREADDEVLKLKARDVVRGALNKDVFENFVKLMRDSTEAKLDTTAHKAVEVLANRFQITDGESSLIERHLGEGGDFTQWGVVNAVTRAAQDLKSYDRNDEFESIGGKILDLPKTQWEEIAHAA